MLTTKQILGEIIKLQEIAEKEYKSQIIGIFGSYARNENTEKSDLDILVRFNKNASLFDWVRISNFIEEKLKVKTDVVSENSLKPEYKVNVLRDLIRI